MKVGIVCPYAFDVPGGVGAHIRDLAETLLEMGHEVSVLAPAEDPEALPPYVVSAGRPIALSSNGSIARISFGPATARATRRWLRERFDVIHVHEPEFPSPSMYAVMGAEVPVVATFHTFGERRNVLFRARGALAPVMERIYARISVSPYARQFQVEHLSHGSVEIPNGVRVSTFATAEPLPGWPGPDGTIGFLGRIDEPRKGFPILLRAFESLAAERPGLRLLVAGPGDAELVTAGLAPDFRDRITFLGLVSEPDKARMLRSLTIYCAPNTGGESFGIILTEAMSSRAPVVASDLDAFRRVLDDGKAGVLFHNEDADDCARAIASLLDDPERRVELADRAFQWVAQYDWRVVAEQVVAVYETVLGAATVSWDGSRPQ